MFTRLFAAGFPAERARDERGGQTAILSRFFAAAEKSRGRRGVIITEPSHTESAGKNAIVNWPLVLIGRIKTFAYTPCLSQPFHWQDVKIGSRVFLKFHCIIWFRGHCYQVLCCSLLSVYPDNNYVTV